MLFLTKVQAAIEWYWYSCVKYVITVKYKTLFSIITES